ncbi:putative RNA helicase [Tieghemostelium lacteum]|uniref:RNA helicase n=1 Tax=Tieghemostelium lacteum TaxID=361077 RepID=A0A152A8M8_TIELA|nr:putative RNA helicase [Tieghemostelium lacteum]|eukprot:KYR02598.1 putative RNA helicase [Tieghemostelium lacteum]
MSNYYNNHRDTRDSGYSSSNVGNSYNDNRSGGYPSGGSSRDNYSGSGSGSSGGASGSVGYSSSSRDNYTSPSSGGYGNTNGQRSSSSSSTYGNDNRSGHNYTGSNGYPNGGGSSRDNYNSVGGGNNNDNRYGGSTSSSSRDNFNRSPPNSNYDKDYRNGSSYNDNRGPSSSSSTSSYGGKPTYEKDNYRNPSSSYGNGNDNRYGSSSSSTGGGYSSSNAYRSNGPSVQPQQSITTPYGGSSSNSYNSNGSSYNSSGYSSSSSGGGYSTSNGHSSSSNGHGSSSNGFSSNYQSNGSSNYSQPPPSSAPGYSSNGSSSSYKPSYGSGSSYGGGSSSYGSGGSSYGGSSSSYGGSSYKPSSGMSYNSAGPKYAGSNEDFGNLQSIQWDMGALTKFEKNFYTEADEVSRMSSESVDSYRKSVCMTVKGRDVPNPIVQFEGAPFPQYLMKEIHSAGFASPTAIQAQAWPIALRGRDIIGLAETGSGKTLAFLLPSIIHINAQPQLQPGDGPIVLVLSPTRELAVQIQTECDKFGGTSKITNCCVYGGAAKSNQISQLKRGVEILVATPGRLIDILSGGFTNLRRVTYLVLDEADRMLDMGFEKQLRSILSQIRPDRQTLMFSATWPKEVQSLAHDFLVDHIQVHIGNADLSANHNVKQIVEVCDEYDKANKLFKFLESINPNDKTIIFAETKRGVDSLQKRLQSIGVKSIGIHGDKSQAERDSVLRDFKTGKTQVMIATDLASRGLDVKDIKYVINFDFPNTVETYVHRIGRTGRAGATGTSFSLFTPDNSRLAKDLVEILVEAKQYVPQPLQNLIQVQPVHSIKPRFNPYAKRY